MSNYGPTQTLVMACALALGAAHVEALDVWERIRHQNADMQPTVVLDRIRQALDDARNGVAFEPYRSPEPEPKRPWWRRAP